MSGQINPNLSDEQKAVLLDGATEAPFSGEFLKENRDGEFVCANCGLVLFDSQHKFDSQCGWPSFDKAVPGAVQERLDESHGMIRQEVVCAKCGGHLGHVFEDGPPETTGLRYCINSLSLDFDPK